MTTFFLSYSRLDQGFALKLADDLIAAGARVWVDQYDIHPSQHWDRAVETAVRSCRGVIVVLSPRSVASPNVADEVAVALDDGKAVIPVLMERCRLPLRMARMQFVDATANYESAVAKCLTAMAKAGAPPGAEPPPIPADAPMSARMRSPLPSEVLRQAELRLTGIVGPIAGVLVRQAADAASEAELYQTLAKSISPEPERKGFLAWVASAGGDKRAGSRDAESQAAPPAEALVLDAADLDDLAAALTLYLGPVARQLIAREQRVSASRAALCQRLAERIADEKERSAFLRAAGAGSGG